jgi:chromosome segregation ATPase
MAGSPEDAVTLEQYGELEVKVIKLRRALAHAQSVTKRQDAALSKTIDRLQTLDEEVKELKEEGSRLEDEIQHLEDELDQRTSLPKLSQHDFTENEIENARKEIEELSYERAKVLVEVEKQKLCNREVGKTIEIVHKRYEHEEKKRRHEIRKLEEKETIMRNEIDKFTKEKQQLLHGDRSRGPSEIRNDSRPALSMRSRASNSRTTMSDRQQQLYSSEREGTSRRSSDQGQSSGEDISFG